MHYSAAKIAAAYSSSEEDENRVVKSKKDSRFDEFRNIVARMRNHQKIDDWASVAKDFEEIQKVRLTLMSIMRCRSIFQLALLRFVFIKILRTPSRPVLPALSPRLAIPSSGNMPDCCT